MNNAKSVNMGMKGQYEAKVRWNRKVKPGFFLMGVEIDTPGFSAVPGQFAMIRISEMDAPLFLRRPLSISQLMRLSDTRTVIEFLYKVVGSGTRALSMKQEGDVLNIIAPLGHGFRHSPKSQIIYLVAGGIGVAPLRFLSRWLIERQVSSKNCRVFLGSRSNDELLCEEEFSDLGFEVVLTTDDGSRGDQCLITHPLENFVRNQPPDIIYACGPNPMLACMAPFIKELGISCQVSIETTMACGLGACLGCAVKAADPSAGYAHACIEGPVFNIDDVVF